MPQELVEQTTLYGMQPLDFQPLVLDWPSISPFLGDTWWLETISYTGNGNGGGTSGPGVGTSGPGVGTSGPGIGTSGPAIGTSGPGAGTFTPPPLAPPETSGPQVGKVYRKPTLQDDEAVEIDPATMGTSGREVGKVVAGDSDFEEFYSTYPVILDRVDLTRKTILDYYYLHLLALPDYRADPEFIKSARQMTGTSGQKAPVWFRNWLFSQPTILQGGFSQPPIYIGGPTAGSIPQNLIKEQRRLDGEEGVCPLDPNQYSSCSYAGFYWANDEIKKMIERSRWIWQQWQPEWDYYAMDIVAWSFAGGHFGGTNAPSFNTSTRNNGFPPVAWGLSKPRAWGDPDFNPIMSHFDYMDEQIKLPMLSLFNPSPVLFRNYTLYSLPVYLQSDMENPVMRINAWVWNKSPIRSLVY